MSTLRPTQFLIVLVTCMSVPFLSREALAQSDISAPVVFPESVFVLQDFVDNYERGLNAGGTHVAFGQDLGQFGIAAGLGRNGGNAAMLQTDADGFAAGAGFIGFGKKFAASTAPDNSQRHTINASAFNAISYWVRANGPDPGSTVQIQLTIDKGGDFQRDDQGEPIDVDGDNDLDSADRLPGSTWTQTLAVPVTQQYKRITRRLTAVDFTRTITKSEGETFDLTRIAAVDILLNATTAQTGQRTLLVDDVNFFTNLRTVEVTQSAVFSPANGTQAIAITATVKENGLPKDGVALTFTLIQTGNGALSKTREVTANGGKAVATYTAGTLADIAEIRVEQE